MGKPSFNGYLTSMGGCRLSYGAHLVGCAELLCHGSCVASYRAGVWPVLGLNHDCFSTATSTELVHFFTVGKGQEETHLQFYREEEEDGG